MSLPCGKIHPDTLRRLLSLVRPGDGVIVGPAYGEDAAAVRAGGKVLVVGADPVTFACDRAGAYAVYINANDVATQGAAPRYFLATVLIPAGASDEAVESVFLDILSACEATGAALVGGHTEITESVTSIVVSGCMMGEVDESGLVRTSGACTGDQIIMTESAGLEGAALLARDAADELLKSGVPSDVIEAARGFLESPGICITRHALTACAAGGVSAMHDPTEGGVATGLLEIAIASGKRLVVDPGRIRIRPETAVIAEALGIDVMGLISSGCLLICAESDLSPSIIGSLKENGISAEVIGEVAEGRAGVYFDDGREFPRFERDELARYYEQVRHRRCGQDTQHRW